MKREYMTPEVEIEKFVISTKAQITTSGFEDGDTGEDVEW
jgi:hypothetical protein